MHRVVESPQRLGTNLEQFEDIGRLLFGRAGFQAVALGSVLTLFGFMVEVFDAEITSWGKHLAFFHIGDYDRDHVTWFELLFLIPLATILFVPAALKSSVKALHFYSVVSVHSIRAIVAILTGLSIWNIVTDWDNHSYAAVNWNIYDQCRGVGMMLHAFSGPFLLPYFLTDMHRPEDARLMCNTISRETTLLYLAVAVTGYLGFAREDGALAHEFFLKVVSPKGDNPTRLVRVLLSVKHFATWPLYFCPFRRVIEALLRWDSAPAIGLRLPWAMQQLRLWKQCLRMALILCTPLVYTLLRLTWVSEDRTNTVFVCLLEVPLAFTVFLWPSLFTAVMRTRRQESGEADWSAPDSGLSLPKEDNCIQSLYRWASDFNEEVSLVSQSRTLRGWCVVMIMCCCGSCTFVIAVMDAAMDLTSLRHPHPH
eukprot:TRINITY_DN33873_c0_g1_i2.p1 TRINITY_DN33873_c0_g1~~TRINITY_DN33873_c0_g1_i2.p1  ORF type:complete len:424 (-),score=48.54 TRINITY_DN33873_c0_g1_i2:54-1325(-)